MKIELKNNAPGILEETTMIIKKLSEILTAVLFSFIFVLKVQ